MYQDIKHKIRDICAKLGRDEPELIAVSKMQPDANVAAVIEAGQRIFGENRVQEAQGKWPEFQQRYGAMELHLLGPLQSNKVKQAAELFDFIHSLDRIKLAKALAKTRDESGKSPKLFVQVNTGHEAQKAGVLPDDLAGFLRDVRDLDLPIIGLMCIPPVDDDPRPHFQQLRQMAEMHDLANLSMGMSGDFEIAIEEGATHIRVGSAIFGARKT